MTSLELWLALTATILEPWKLAAGERTALNCWTPDPKVALEERDVAGAATTADPATDIMVAIVEIEKSKENTKAMQEAELITNDGASVSRIEY